MSVIGQAEGINHGTPSGYKQHLNRKVEMCNACREANRKVRATARQKARQSEALVKAANEASKPRLYVRPYSPHPPGWQDPAWGEPIAGRDLAVGDVIVFLGQHYPVDRIESYQGSLDSVLSVKGEPARTAYSGDWDMAIGPDRTIRILPREGR